MARVTIVPTNRDEVHEFIRRHHRHHPRPTGFVALLAAADETGRVVGVAVIGRPVAHPLQDGWTCEVTRSCTDGTGNVNSALYGAAWRAARALGYRRAVTYTQDGETGASLRAAGWQPAATLRPRPGWDMPGRRRDDADYIEIGRTRWEIRAEAPPWPVRPAVALSPSSDEPGLFDEEAC